MNQSDSFLSFVSWVLQGIPQPAAGSVGRGEVNNATFSRGDIIRALGIVLATILDGVEMSVE